MTITYTDGGDKAGNSARADCTTGSETSNFETANDPKAGLMLGPFSAFNLHVEGKGAGTVAGGVMRCYMRNPLTGNWNPAPKYDIPMPVAAKRGYSLALTEEAIGNLVQTPRDRIAYVPDGVTAVAGMYVDLLGSP